MIMAVTEQDRRNIFNGLEATIGAEQANKLMELLPNTSANELVTRDDMHSFGTGLRGEIKGEMAELRGEMAELRGEMAELRGDISLDLARAHAATQRLIVAGMIGNAIAVITALAV